MPLSVTCSRGLTGRLILILIVVVIISWGILHIGLWAFLPNLFIPRTERVTHFSNGGLVEHVIVEVVIPIESGGGNLKNLKF